MKKQPKLKGCPVKFALEVHRRRYRRSSLSVRRAFIFLERHGKRFAVDYGFDNAVNIARFVRAERKCKP